MSSGKVEKYRKIDRNDGWASSLTGVGTSRDKVESYHFSVNKRLTSKEEEDLYHDDDTANFVCNAYPEESLSRGFCVKLGIDEESRYDIDSLDNVRQVEFEIHSSMEKLDFTHKVVDALVWGNVFGGAAILPGIDDGAIDMAEPLNEENIKSIDFVNVIDSQYIQPLTWYTNPTEAKFGSPMTYLITPEVASTSAAAAMTATEVHETRLVLVGGVRTSNERKRENNGWDDSRLQRMHRILQSWGLSWQLLTHLMQDAQQGVFKMDGLIDALSSQESDLIHKRLALLDASRSLVRATVLDAESETFERQEFDWAGTKEPFELLMMRLSQASGIPVTILMGRSPAGQNATGESDFRAWYDRVSVYQQNAVKPILHRLVELVFLSKTGPTKGEMPEKWTIEFPALVTPTEKEKAETREIQSRADVNYITSGVLTPEEVALSRFGPDGWDGETKIDPIPRTIAAPESEQIDEPTDG